MAIIDIHSHFFPPVERQTAAGLSPSTAPWLDTGDGEHGHIMIGERRFRPVRRALWDPAARLEEMDAAGIDTQVICATPVMFGYEQPVAAASDWAQRMNDLAVAHHQAAPARIKALAQVPLQDTEAACAEVTRARENGLIGVQIGNHVGSRDMDDEGIITFLQHCASEAMPVLVHPWDMLGAERMQRYMLPWLVAMPAETQLSILSLILSGALERLPRSLKICFAHGGGSFAFLLGRVDNAWRHRDIVREACPNPPSSYTDRIHVDACVFDSGALRLLVDVMGRERVMFGTDFPFPLGEQDPGNLIRTTEGLTDETRERLFGSNAQAFFGV